MKRCHNDEKVLLSKMNGCVERFETKKKKLGIKRGG